MLKKLFALASLSFSLSLSAGQDSIAYYAIDADDGNSYEKLESADDFYKVFKSKKKIEIYKVDKLDTSWENGCIAFDGAEDNGEGAVRHLSPADEDGFHSKCVEAVDEGWTAYAIVVDSDEK